MIGSKIVGKNWNKRRRGLRQIVGYPLMRLLTPQFDRWVILLTQHIWVFEFGMRHWEKCQHLPDKAKYWQPLNEVPDVNIFSH